MSLDDSAAEIRLHAPHLAVGLVFSPRPTAGAFPSKESFMNSPMPAEVAEDFRVRAHAIIRSWLRGDVEGLVSLTGDDADELLPMVVQILMDALLQCVSRETVEQNLDEWFAKRLAA